jgi:hypothetical protein
MTTHYEAVGNALDMDLVNHFELAANAGRCHENLSAPR